MEEMGEMLLKTLCIFLAWTILDVILFLGFELPTRLLNGLKGTDFHLERKRLAKEMSLALVIAYFIVNSGGC